MSKRLAILTGGGDCPGLNNVIRAVVFQAVKKYGYEVLAFEYGWKYKTLLEHLL